MKNFIKCAMIRAIRTFAQAAVAAIGSTAMLSEVNWPVVASTAALAAILSMLTSISTGLPEASCPESGSAGPMGPAAAVQIEDLKRGTEAETGGAPKDN